MTTDAFGVVAMVALTPLLTVQVLGLIYRLKEHGKQPESERTDLLSEYDDQAIIEL